MDTSIKYIVFDLNGTLVDAISTYIRIFCDILEKRAGIDPSESAEYSTRAAGTPWDEQFAFMLKKNRLNTREAPEMTEEFFRLVDREKYSLYPQAKEVLESFRSKGCKIFISSASKTGPMIKRIYDMGILPYVDFLVGADIYPKSSRHLELLAQKEEISLQNFARQAVYFGDGPGDMKIAKTSGLHAIGVAQTVSADLLRQSGADLTIEKIADILEAEWQ